MNTYELYVAPIIHFTVFMPLGWWALMFAIQLIHWSVAWVDDAKTTTNVMMRWTMLHVLGYRDTPPDDNQLFVTKCGANDEYSDGSVAIWAIPFILACIPLTIATLVEFYQLITVIVLVGIVAFGLRMIRRLSKVVRGHINNQKVHNKENIQ